MTTTIIFDLGAVLIDWHPFHLYKSIFSNEEEMRFFIENICTNAWNEEQDGGRSLAEGTELLVKEFPDHEENIRAYYGRWEEMLNGPIQGTVKIFKELKDSGRFKIYALTNWAAETYPIAQSKFEFLNWFDGVVVSGTERMRKPHPEFYQLLLDRYSVSPAEAVFIDDNFRNVEAGRKLGIDSIHFKNPEQLREELQGRKLL
ncbi:HAD family phosphatase [Pedobacter sp. SYSU D00535]|uniref:HAD family hydrolase n=1 Tax=Pedobacter sp. SYSU D00535 TaxID=2810308 RepID=UPI001A960B22|nr:HAD family phosphatase [Pedobacter sp. SYSU D00535]